MVIQYHCPKCGAKKACTRYGKFRTSKPESVQRIRCKKCGRTSSRRGRHPFFNHMRTEPVDMLAAVITHNEHRHSIRKIAWAAEISPTTLIKWIKKIKLKKSLFRHYLRTERNYSYAQANTFFSDLSFWAKKKRTRQLKQYQGH